MVYPTPIFDTAELPTRIKAISGEEGWVQSELLPEDWLMKKYNKKGDREFKIRLTNLKSYLIRLIRLPMSCFGILPCILGKFNCFLLSKEGHLFKSAKHATDYMMANSQYTQEDIGNVVKIYQKVLSCQPYLSKSI